MGEGQDQGRSGQVEEAAARLTVLVCRVIVERKEKGHEERCDVCDWVFDRGMAVSDDCRPV